MRNQTDLRERISEFEHILRTEVWKIGETFSNGEYDRTKALKIGEILFELLKQIVQFSFAG